MDGVPRLHDGQLRVLMKPGMFRDPFGPHLPGAEALPFSDIDAMANAIKAGDVAALVVEPVQLEGGVRCRARSSSSVRSDCEARRCSSPTSQTGLGRNPLPRERGVAAPADVVILGKHLGGGLVPISAMITRADLFEQAYGRHYAQAEAHNTTFSGSAIACVAALAALDLLTDDLIARIKRVGDWWRGRLAETLARHELLEEVRGVRSQASCCGRQIIRGCRSSTASSRSPTNRDRRAGCHRMYKRGFTASPAVTTGACSGSRRGSKSRSGARPSSTPSTRARLLQPHVKRATVLGGTAPSGAVLRKLACRGAGGVHLPARRGHRACSRGRARPSRRAL
jgi:hypothetical protein